MPSRNSDQRHRHMHTLEQDDVADALPTECYHHAIQKEALVDLTFLQRLKRQRDMRSKQLRAPVFVPAASAVSIAIKLLIKDNMTIRVAILLSP